MLSLPISAEKAGTPQKPALPISTFSTSFSKSQSVPSLFTLLLKSLAHPY